MAKTYPVLTAPKPKVLVVHCIDPRFQEAFRQFLAEELKLQDGDYILLPEAGSVVGLTEPLSQPKTHKVTRDKFDFVLGHFPAITRVVLINHEDCAAYKAMQHLLGAGFLLKHGHSMEQRHLNDLAVAAKVIGTLAGRSLLFEHYYARFADEGRTQVVFQQV